MVYNAYLVQSQSSSNISQKQQRWQSILLNCLVSASVSIMDARTEVSDATEASSRPRIAQLPASCDPPQPNAAVKQLVWVV
jgi:hypothetical protein